MSQVSRSGRSSSITTLDEQTIEGWSDLGDLLNDSYRAAYHDDVSTGRYPPMSLGRTQQDESFAKLPGFSENNDGRSGIFYTTYRYRQASAEHGSFTQSQAEAEFALGRRLQRPAFFGMTKDPAESLDALDRFGADVAIVTKSKSAKDPSPINNRRQEKSEEIAIDPEEFTLPRFTPTVTSLLEKYPISNSDSEIHNGSGLFVFQHTRSSTPVREEDVDARWLARFRGSPID